MLIGLSGYAQSGKDTFAGFLIDLGWKRYALADSLKAAAYSLDPIVETIGGRYSRLSSVVDNIGWDAAKQLEDVRRLLQRLGTEVGRNYFGETCWTDVLDRQLDAAADPLVVITDVRFPNEVEWVESRGGTHIRIERPGVGALNGHASEQALDEFTPTYIIENSGGLEQLRDAAETVHTDLISRGY